MSVLCHPEYKSISNGFLDQDFYEDSDSVDIDNNQALGYQANYGSTSNSSLSSGSSNDSPSSSVDNTFTLVSHSAGSSLDNENDYIEADPPDWQSSLSEEELARLQPHEKKRQDVINELFHTERTHLRNLKVLERVFCKRIQEHKLLKDDEISLLFPNLSDLISIHSKFNTLMMGKKKDVILVREVGDILMSIFDGPMGDSFQKAAATFCEKQQHALDFIKEKRRKDSKFETYLTEFEKDPACRRLPLQGFVPSEMQRLSKYPLLLERLIDVVEKNAESEMAEYSQTELSNLQQAHNRSKEILNYVNEAAKQAWSKFRLQEIHKHLDTSVFEKTEHAIVNEFKNLDLTKYNLIYEGTVQLKRQNKGLLNVHMVLLEEVVILLQREGDRFLLKFFQSGIPGQQPLAPIIKMSTLLVRTNAALKCSLFLVNTSTQHSQMHELLTRDNTERKTFYPENVEWMAEHFLGRKYESRGGALTNMTEMELYLRTLGDPGFQEGVGADLGIHQSTVSKTINEVASKIVRRKGMWIRFHLTPNELEEAKRGWHMPDAIGAVDCTHIRIRKPVLNGEEYFNRKGFSSINVQATCNYNECFTSVDVSRPGSVHDSRVWRNSDVFQIMKSNINHAYLLGDEGYGIAPWLMTPYRNPNILTENLYNRIHTTDRIIIERCFGQLKSRFLMLANTMRLKLNYIPVYITSAFILHSVAKNVHDPNDFLPLQNREEP